MTVKPLYQELGLFTCLLWLPCAQLLATNEVVTPGTFDSTFKPPRFDDVAKVLPLPDGRLIVGVWRGLLRVNPDGSLDQTFAPTSGVAYRLTALAVQPDGKLLVGNEGGWRNYPSSGFGRYLPDGTRDRTFRFDAPTNTINDGGYWSGSWTKALAVQPDGKIFWAGAFERDYFDYEIWANAGVDRLSSDGDLEAYDDRIGDPSIEVLLAMPEQRVLVGGSKLSRLNADLTRDTSFTNTVLTEGRISCCATQTDGRILIGGTFMNIQGRERCRIARLMPDGTIDLSFNPPASTGSNSSVNAIAVQPDGRILMGGTFQTVDGSPYELLARLNSDGSLDRTFPPLADVKDPEEDHYSVSAIIIQNPMRAIIGGSNLGNPAIPNSGNLFRIELGEPALWLSAPRVAGGTIELTFTSPFSGSNDFILLTATNLSVPASNWTVLGSATNTGDNRYRFAHPLGAPASQRFYKLARVGPTE